MAALLLAGGSAALLFAVGAAWARADLHLPTQAELLRLRAGTYRMVARARASRPAGSRNALSALLTFCELAESNPHAAVPRPTREELAAAWDRENRRAVTDDDRKLLLEMVPRFEEALRRAPDGDGSLPIRHSTAAR